MVVIDLPSTSSTGIAQERTARPSTCTVQAPQDAMPQPNFVPVILRCSRSTHSSGVVPSTATSLRCPFTVNAAICASFALPTDYDDADASVPIPKFASLCGTLVCELRNRRTLDNLLL